MLKGTAPNPAGYSSQGEELPVNQPWRVLGPEPQGANHPLPPSCPSLISAESLRIPPPKLDHGCWLGWGEERVRQGSITCH